MFNTTVVTSFSRQTKKRGKKRGKEKGKEERNRGKKERLVVLE